MATIPVGVMLVSEATPGTLEAPLGMYAVECARCDFTPTMAPIRRNLWPGRLDYRKPATPHGRYWQIDLEGEVKTAEAGPSIEIDTLLLAAGFDSAGADPVVYTLMDEPNAVANQQSVSLIYEEGLDGNTYAGHGFRPGNLQFSFGIDQALRWSCSGPAGYNVPAAVVANTALTLNAGVPYVYLGTGTPFAIGAYTGALLRSGTISIGLEASPRAHMAGDLAPGFYTWPAVLNRPPDGHVSFSFEIESQDETAFAAYTAWAAGTSQDIVLTFTAGGLDLDITLGDCVFDPPTRTAGAPNMMTLTGTASFNGTDGAITLSFDLS